MRYTPRCGSGRGKVESSGASLLLIRVRSTLCWGLSDSCYNTLNQKTGVYREIIGRVGSIGVRLTKDDVPNALGSFIVSYISFRVKSDS